MELVEDVLAMSRGPQECFTRAQYAKKCRTLTRFSLRHVRHHLKPKTYRLPIGRTGA